MIAVLAGGVGATLEAPPEGVAPHAWFFGEDQARYVIAANAREAAAILVEAETAGVPARTIGRTGGAALTASGDDPISLAQLRGAHEGGLPGYMSSG